jgi:hypothetical protein
MSIKIDNELLKKIGKAIILILALICIVQNCSGDKVEVDTKMTDTSVYFAKMKADSIKYLALEKKYAEKELEVIASKHREDSLKKVSDKNYKSYVAAKNGVKDDFGRGICDTVKIKEAFNQCDTVISGKDREIAQKDTTINKLEDEKKIWSDQKEALKGEVEAARTIIKVQADDNKALQKEIKHTKRKHKIKTVLATIGVALENALLIFALK